MLNPSEEISMRAAQAGLVDRLKQGEAAAWQELCEKYSEPLYLFALHRTGCDPAAADDICQETFLAVVRAIQHYRGVVPLFGWLCCIVRQHGEQAALWALFVEVTHLVGLIAYLIVIRTAQPAKA